MAKVWFRHRRLEINISFQRFKGYKNFKRVFLKIPFFKCGGKIIQKRLHGFVSNFYYTFTITFSRERPNGLTI